MTVYIPKMEPVASDATWEERKAAFRAHAKDMAACSPRFHRMILGHCETAIEAEEKKRGLSTLNPQKS